MSTVGRRYQRSATTGEKVVQILLGFLVVGIFTLICFAYLVVLVKVQYHH